MAGLIAAQYLERAGLRPLLVEATDRPGGRVKTDEQEGFLLDHGFQVLLTAYPEVQTYLNTELLDLQPFHPGAIVFSDRYRVKVTDPMRQLLTLPTMLVSPIGTFRDKVRVFWLAQQLKRKSPAELFTRDSKTTLAFLRDYGFSNHIIKNFFRPFLGGIFLEQELSTPASMFQFVFKMFGEGYAAVPSRGMEAIPQQLVANLKQSQFRFNSKVRAVESDLLRLDDGETIPYDALIIATDPSGLMPGLPSHAQPYHGTTCLYFSADIPPVQGAWLALVADRDNPINNFCTLSAAAPYYAPPGKHLVSVTLKELRSDAAVVTETAAALARLCQVPLGAFTFLRSYHIPQALPALSHLAYDIQPSQTRLHERVFLAGDHLLNGSLDAAMRSGRQAALGIVGSL